MTTCPKTFHEIPDAIPLADREHKVLSAVLAALNDIFGRFARVS